jgi:hypothetical protein
LKIILALFAVIGAISGADTQTAPATQTKKITAESVWELYLKAAGGVEERLELHSIEIVGSLTSLTGLPAGDEVHFWRVFPDSDLLEFTMRSHGIVKIGHNGGKPFLQGNVAAVMILNDVTVGMMEQAMQAITESDWKVRFTSIELLGAAEVHHRKTYAIGLTLKNGDRQVWYFDAESHLLTRIALAEHMKETSGRERAYMVEVDFSDYDERGGLKFPSTIAFECSSCGIKFTLQEIKPNVPIHETTFSQRSSN